MKRKKIIKKIIEYPSGSKRIELNKYIKTDEEAEEYFRELENDTKD